MNLNDELLQHFMTTFYGSGNYSGDYWFIGMEEGGGKNLDQVTARLNAWIELGQTELVDIYDFHIKINHPEYFRDPVKLQRTWMQQARIVLSAKGLSSETQSIREYQRDVIGRENSETCLLELLPLPSPNSKVWNYKDWTTLRHLSSREAYSEYCIPWRIEHLRFQINAYKPKVVVFLGIGKVYFKFWRAVASQSVHFLYHGGYWAGQADGTKYIISEHPNYHGITNAYFESIGSHIYQSK